MKSSVTLLARLIKLYLDLGWFFGLIAGAILLVLTPFVIVNAPRIEEVVIGYHRVAPLAMYLVGGILLVGLSIRGLTLKPPVYMNPDALFLGLAILVLSEVFRQASELQREQSLTV